MHLKEERLHEVSRQAALERDAGFNRITLDPVLPAYGAPGMADQVFNLRSLPAHMLSGFAPDHLIVRSTLRSPYGGHILGEK